LDSIIQRYQAMKSVVVFLVIAAVSAQRSGPYLPSGWKPNGPAFMLPTEVKESPAPQEYEPPESEASGSNFLQEYGPPDNGDIYQSITRQALPDLFTERAFLDVRIMDQNSSVSQIKSNELESVEDIDKDIVDEIFEVKKDENSATADKSVTDMEDKTTEISMKNELQKDDINPRISEPDEVTIEKTKTITETITDDEMTSTEIPNDENKSVIEETVDSGSPKQTEDEVIGFREYGPPKGDDVSDRKSEITVKNDELRKRRYSKIVRVNKH
jgi:hypothetical protein